MIKNFHSAFFSYTGQRITRHGGSLNLVDISVGLGRICRYAGASWQFWPSLLHSFIVADLVPGALEAHALLHDMTDVLFGDIPKPFKLAGMLALQNRMHARMLVSLGLPPLDEKQKAIIKTADNRAFVGERRILAPPGIGELLGSLRDPAAEDLTLKYLRRYLIEDLVRADGAAVKDFLQRASSLISRRVWTAG